MKTELKNAPDNLFAFDFAQKDVHSGEDILAVEIFSMYDAKGEKQLYAKCEVPRFFDDEEHDILGYNSLTPELFNAWKQFAKLVSPELLRLCLIQCLHDVTMSPDVIAKISLELVGENLYDRKILQD